MHNSSRTYTQEEVTRLRRLGFVVEGTNVAYDDELAGSQGARFWLINEGQIEEELKKAERWLLNQRDVVGSIGLAKVVLNVPSGTEMV